MTSRRAQSDGKGWSRWLALCLVLALTWLLAPPATAGENLENRADVKEMTQALEQNNYVRARELAEAMLRREPRNYCACYVLGAVYLWAEGSLPRAHHYLSRARKLIRSEFGEPVPSSGPWSTHATVLLLLAETCGEMEKYKDQLRFMQVYDEQYVPKRPEDRGWPLMKLGKLDEAREVMKQVLEDSQDQRPRQTALNTLGAIEIEAHDIAKSREWYAQLMEEIARNGWSMECTFPRNLAEAEIELGNYARGEELLLESTKHENPYAFTNPWGDLAELYLTQGRFPELISAIKRMQAWAAGSMPVVVNQTWAERYYMTAEALLACGYDDAAEPMLRRVVYRPDRNMATSSKAYSQEAMTLVMFRNTLLCRIQRLREEMSWCEWKVWFVDLAVLAARNQELGEITDRAAALVVANDGLRGAVQAYQSDSIYGSWLLPDVNNLFGVGVVASEVNRALQDRDHPNLEVERPFLQAVLAEGCWLRGDTDRASEALNAALKDLPPSQVLIRARLEALLGQVLWDQGQRQEALGHISRAFEMDAGVFRRLGLSLPARITSGGGPLADQAASALRNSPRFFSHADGFQIQVSQGGSGLTASLLDGRGTRVADVASPNKKTGDETVRFFCARFHEYVFSARLDLGQADINSLDGSTQASNLARNQLMESLQIEAKGQRPPP